MSEYLNQCECGWVVVTSADSIQVTCPLCAYKFTAHSLSYVGRQLWSELHTMRDPSITKFRQWAAKLPRFSCACTDHLEQYISHNPPDLENWFAWTVGLHNYINRILGKEILTVEQASAIWLDSTPST